MVRQEPSLRLAALTAMSLERIDDTTTVEELVEAWPDAVGFLRERYDLRVICCGAPVWATLGELERSRNIASGELVSGVRERFPIATKEG